MENFVLSRTTRVALYAVKSLGHENGKRFYTPPHAIRCIDEAQISTVKRKKQVAVKLNMATPIKRHFDNPPLASPQFQARRDMPHVVGFKSDLISFWFFLLRLPLGKRPPPPMGGVLAFFYSNISHFQSFSAYSQNLAINRSILGECSFRRASPVPIL